jgi:hypothetical protein
MASQMMHVVVENWYWRAAKGHIRKMRDGMPRAIMVSDRRSTGQKGYKVRTAATRNGN